jgi:hypothetical protein
LQARMVVRYATTQIAASPVSTVPVELAPASSPGASPVVTKE